MADAQRLRGPGTSSFAQDALNQMLDKLHELAHRTARSVARRARPTRRTRATRTCADLGHRLFLRTMKAYFVEISEERCAAFNALGERLGYPEFLVDDNLNVRND
ncbi:hypothetical protein [Streptomyces sp. TP-A0356]|uniref:hypothetical protein n=1 Tax=Streptomyces sp. TP-A0356 TaxID=1359208 RepID=UPI0006E21CF5|nr:hypothetical protein [Streptomyces sp. TP-A0356]